MILRITLLILIVVATTQGAISSPVIAKINGLAVTEEEARLILDKKTPLSEADIEKVVLFQLAVEKAVTENFDHELSTATSIKKVLYKAYLKNISNKNSDKLRVSKAELEAYYNENPLLRIYQIVLKGTPDKNTLKISQLLKEHEAGVPFRKLVLKYSEDPSALQGGDLDFRSTHNFPEALFTSVKKLPKNTLSPALSDNGTTFFFLWTAKKTFGEAPETYKNYLASKLEEKRELALLRESLGNLRKNAAVEIVGMKPNE